MKNVSIQTLTPAEIVDNLTYSSYKFNRLRRPDIPAEKWEKVFGESTTKLEEKFQYDIAKN